jgi:hypothetical protein
MIFFKQILIFLSLKRDSCVLKLAVCSIYLVFKSVGLLTVSEVAVQSNMEGTLVDKEAEPCEEFSRCENYNYLIYYFGKVVHHFG